MKKLLLILSASAMLLFSCSKEHIQIGPDNSLLGTWTFTEYKDGLSVFSKSEDFINNYCYKFNADGTMVERKNAGWCGTPPVAFADFPGSWSIINDTMIQINVGYWGGTTSYKLEIISVSPTILKVQTISDN